MRLLPRAHPPSRLVEDAFVVPLANLLARLTVEQLPEGRVLVVDPEIRLLVFRCHFIGAEEEAVGVAVDNVRDGPRRLGRGDRVLRDLAPRDVEVDVFEGGVFEQLFDERALRLRGAHDAPDADVRPDDGGVGVALEERLDLLEVCGRRALLREGRVDVVVYEDDEPDLRGEVYEAVERRVVEARDLARDLCGDELFMNAELAYPR